MSTTNKLVMIVLALGALVVPILFLFQPVAQFVASAPSCMESSEAVQYARSLTVERLNRLYYQMEEFSRAAEVPPNGFFKGEIDSMPEAFSDLQVRRVRPLQGNIMVEGCMDHHVYLDFVGLNSSSSGFDRRIVLRWGERPPNQGSEILWTEGADATRF